jgi:hypothetical protein
MRWIVAVTVLLVFAALVGLRARADAPDRLTAVETRMARAEERIARVDERLAAIEALAGRAREDAGRGTAEIQMVHFDQVIRMFYVKWRRLPESLDELTKKDPATGEAYMDAIPKDPWGNAYILKVLGRSKFQLVSFGPDGLEGTADDLAWPKTDD